MSGMNIKVLGGGCAKCESLLENVREAVRNRGAQAEIEYITDFSVIASLGIMSTPALMVDGRVVCAGRVLKSSEIEKLL
jgi:small redox-active disulfide protein 2